MVCECVLVAVEGPDPKVAKGQAAPFHARPADGVTRLSCSGLVAAIPESDGKPLVIASLASIYPFLTQDVKHHVLSATHTSLVWGTRIRGNVGSKWVTLRLLGVGVAPGVQEALATLLSASSVAGPGGWRLGWPGQQLAQSGSIPWAALAPYVAVLAPEPGQGGEALQAAALALSPAVYSLTAAGSTLRGASITAVGAPFGALAPAHFQGFLSSGVVSNVLLQQQCSAGRSPHSQAPPSLLVADLRCLPGMEGGPVVDSQGRLVGILAPPIAAPAPQAQLAVVIPAHSVAAACAAVVKSAGGGAQAASVVGPAESQTAAAAVQHPEKQPHLAAAACQSQLPQEEQPCTMPSRQPEQPGQLASALPSVVAVVAGSSWASGVIISHKGHVLTNAHLFEPRLHPSQLRLVTSSAGSAQQAAAADVTAPAAGAAQLICQPTDAAQLPPSPISRGTRHSTARVLVHSHSTASGEQRGFPGSAQPGWHLADVVYVFSGPLDLAVLQLQLPQDPMPGLSIPAGLNSLSTAACSEPVLGQEQEEGPWVPLKLDEGEGAVAGCPACVAGYPLFNPTNGLGLWVTQGNVARVVQAGGEPAMLLTTASVHSGASGGAAIHPGTGALLGLVTSNAKHANGSLYPNLNFSIPALLLRPVVNAVASSGSMAAAAAALAALDARLAADAELCALWGLSFSAKGGDGEGTGPDGKGGGASRGMGPFGGARPPQALAQLLDRIGKGDDSRGASNDSAGGPKSKL